MADVAPAYALHCINFTIQPDQIFVPNTQQERDELLALEAIRELSDAEATVFAQQQAAAAPKKGRTTAPASDDVIG